MAPNDKSFDLLTDQGMKPLFLNVDLDIVSRKNLDPLIVAMGSRVVVLHHERVPGSRNYFLRVERNRATKGTPESVTRELCNIIDALSPTARRVWQSARKEFNIGYELRVGERYSGFSLRPETLARVAQLGANLGVTYYRGIEELPRTSHQQEEAKKLGRIFYGAPV
jgi:hypothetical protein